jgi:hypothetical protein
MMTDTQFISLLFCIGFSAIWIVIAIKMAADEAVEKITAIMETNQKHVREEK